MSGFESTSSPSQATIHLISSPSFFMCRTKMKLCFIGLPHPQQFPFKVSYFVQGAQTGALWQPRGVAGIFKREGTYIPLWLIHSDVWQKSSQYCKAIILQLKIKILKCCYGSFQGISHSCYNKLKVITEGHLILWICMYIHTWWKL